MHKYFLKLKKQNYQKGQALLISLVFFTSISLAVTTGLVVPTVKEFKIANTNVNAKKSYVLSESGIEDAFYRVKTSKTIGASETITIDGNSVTTNITTVGNQKTISSEGDVLDYNRKNELVLVAGTGISFSYGIQAGQGGITLNNSARVSGSVYSNGPITVNNSGAVTGSAFSANGSNTDPNQENDSGSPTHNINFANTTATEDFAQSFTVSTTTTINKLELYLRKVGTPSDVTVRIYNNGSGVPGTTELASGTLSAGSVSTTYSWMNIPLSSNPTLTSGTTYWFVIDSSSTNSSRYYQIGANDAGYINGVVKVGKSSSWVNASPSTLDSFFRIYMGTGTFGSISGATIGSAGVGNAYAHTVTNSTIAGTNYCQTGTGNNKTCDSSLADPTQVAMPITDQNILDWKATALAGGTTTGSINLSSGSHSYGPRKIVGNMDLNNSVDVTLNGVLWITGNFSMSNNSTLRLSSSYGGSEGLIIVDGTITISNSSQVLGSGTSGSYIMLLSTSTSSSAINLSNSGRVGILYAHNGTVQINNDTNLVAVTGKNLSMNNNATITFDSGLVNSNFVTGPSGGWSVSSWKETE